MKALFYMGVGAVVYGIGAGDIDAVGIVYAAADMVAQHVIPAIVTAVDWVGGQF